MSRALWTLVALAMAITPAPAAAQGPYELTVKADHAIGASRGTLLFDCDGVEYRTTDRHDARKWRYDDIRQLQVLDPRHVRLLTFEDQGRLKFGKERTFDFQVAGGTVTPELVAFLLAHIERPVVTAVMPPDGACAPLSRIPVKHDARHGSEGALVMHADHLAYVTERPQDSRFWRWSDIASVMKLSPYRLVVSTYEGGAGETRPFVFDLKRDLPEDQYAALWARVNPPARPFGAVDPACAGHRAG